MAYNYNPNYFYPNLQQQQMQQPQQIQQAQSGFVSVRSEAEARSYPVAYGNSVTFKDENAPYIYTKTMGFSQLDRPIFDKYKLVKEDATPEAPETPQNGSEHEKMRKDIAALWEAVNVLKQEEKLGA